MRFTLQSLAVLAISASTVLGAVFPRTNPSVKINFDSRSFPSFITFPGYTITSPKPDTSISGIKPHSGSLVAFNDIPVHPFSPHQQWTYPGIIKAAPEKTFTLESFYIASTQGSNVLVVGFDAKGETLGFRSFTCAYEMTLANLVEADNQAGPLEKLSSVAIIVQNAGQNVGYAIDDLVVRED